MEKTLERPKARRTDILPNDAAKIDGCWRRHYERLLQMHEHLTDRRGDAVRNAQSEQPNFSLSLGDSGTDEYDAGAALGLLSQEQNAIYEIEQAIRRIQEGRYGICEATGEKISDERLEAIPWTRFARDVEENLEREEQSRKPKHVF
jgi:RNA polymerase-binding transcription factor DksA